MMMIIIIKIIIIIVIIIIIMVMIIIIIYKTAFLCQQQRIKHPLIGNSYKSPLRCDVYWREVFIRGRRLFDLTTSYVQGSMEADFR